VRQNFLSAPVLMKTRHKWYGFVEIGDIVEFYIEHFGGEREKKSSVFVERTLCPILTGRSLMSSLSPLSIPEQLGNEGKVVWDTIAEKEGFMDKTVDDIMSKTFALFVCLFVFLS